VAALGAIVYFGWGEGEVKTKVSLNRVEDRIEFFKTSNKFYKRVGWVEVKRWESGGWEAAGEKGKRGCCERGGRMFIVARDGRGDLAALFCAQRFHGQARLL
jgi:hypothetical protein